MNWVIVISLRQVYIGLSSLCNLITKTGKAASPAQGHIGHGQHLWLAWWAARSYNEGKAEALTKKGKTTYMKKRRWKVLDFDKIDVPQPARYRWDGKFTILIERDENNNWLTAQIEGQPTSKITLTSWQHIDGVAKQLGLV